MLLQPIIVLKKDKNSKIGITVSLNLLINCPYLSNNWNICSKIKNPDRPYRKLTRKKNKNGYRYTWKCGITIASIRKVKFNCTEYVCLVQDLKGKKKILSQVREGLSKIPSLKVLSCKLHGGYWRKRLVSGERVWENFFLIRIQLKYKIGSKIYKPSPVIYPSDVYPYGRQTLDVEVKSFETLTFCYRHRMLGGRFCSRGFREDLFSP